MAVNVRRRFVDLGEAQIHYREAGAGRPGTPLVMLHSAAASSRMLETLAGALGGGRRVIAPDLPGCGDSTPLPGPETSVEELAGWLAAGLDALGLDTVDLHGLHLGARIAVELALARRGRVRRLIIDGNGFYDGDLGEEMQARVAPTLQPDLDGLYLQTAWHYIRDYYLFFPWFRRDAAHRRAGGLPAPQVIHEKLLEVLRNGTTYGKPYRAAFRYPMEAKLPLLDLPTLVAAARDDNVFDHLQRTAALVPGCRTAATAGILSPAAAAETAAAFAEFLDA